jgi:Skp family chaperone for outer membrane proteins
MKKISFLLILIPVLFYSCNSAPEKKKVSTVPKVASRDLKGFTIVYYSNDSIKQNFLYYKEQDAIVTRNQKAFQTELERRTSELQQYIQRNSEKQMNGLLSENEVAQIQQKAQQMEQSVMQYQQVEVLGKKYCELHKIDLMLIHGDGGQLNYVNPSMDVTKEFIAFLNENQASIENDLKK